MVEGQEVSIYYDPMLAKLVAWGPTREASLARMEVALSEFLALGVITNIPLLRAVMQHSQFQRGEYDTGFLEWNPAVTRPAASGEAWMMAQALAAWASAQSDGAVATQTSGTPAKAGIHRVSPWQSAGARRLP